jgi:pyruvate formate lyase activating enzyme
MGRVHSIETMGAVDGPGLRMVVFLQGCPLRCKFCHNPDTWDFAGGREVSAEEICDQAVRCRRFFGKEGGITFSGGEPLAQARFVRECVRLLHARGIHCAVDTGGGVAGEEALALLDEADLVLLDIKHSDPDAFRELTGGDPAALARVLAHLARTRKPVWVRQVILEGYTQSEEQVRAMLREIAGISAVKIELLPYHTLGAHKWEALGVPYPLEGVRPPDGAEMERLRALTR